MAEPKMKMLRPEATGVLCFGLFLVSISGGKWMFAAGFSGLLTLLVYHLWLLYKALTWPK